MSEDKPGYKQAADGHTYHKSATANATTAPTNEATKVNAAKTAGLTKAEAELVTVLDYEWHLKGDLSPEGIKDEYGYEDDEWDKLVNSKTLQQALKERGINFKSIAPDSEIANEAGRAKLTPIQLIVANSVLDLVDARPIKKKLADANVSPYQYQSWLKDPNFSAYLKERAEGLLGDVQHEAMLALVDKMMGGDLKAIEYYHEITGRFVRQTSQQAGNNSTDLQTIIVRIIEIISDEADYETAVRINERLKALVMGNQVAGVLPAPVEIQTPEIAAARVMTPAVQEMIERGVGVNE